MATKKQDFFAVMRPDLVWFLLGDIVADAHGLFAPDYRGAAKPLDQIYRAIQHSLLVAARSGELPVRVWPLWNKVPVERVGDCLDGSGIEAGYGIAIGDLHEWLKHTHYPTAKTPEALLGVFRARWATMQDGPETKTITPSGERSFQEIGFSSLEQGEKDSWYRRNARDFVEKAINGGATPDRKHVIEWVLKNIPEAEGSSRATWERHIKGAVIDAVYQSVKP